MFERFTPDARIAVVRAQEHARQLGHRYIGCEHLLLAVSSADTPVSAVLREHGITPGSVEEEIVQRAGLGAGAALFEGLDRDALSAIGIDLDAVRARIEASFSPEALAMAARSVHPRPRPSRLNPRRAIPPRVMRALRRRRVHIPGPPPAGHLPFTARARKVLENSLREAAARHDRHIGVEHLALALITMTAGMVPPILAALDASGPALRAAIVDRYRQAS